MTAMLEDYEPTRPKARRAVICVFCSRPTGEFAAPGENAMSYYCADCYDLPRPYPYDHNHDSTEPLPRMNVDRATPQYRDEYDDDDL